MIQKLGISISLIPSVYKANYTEALEMQWTKTTFSLAIMLILIDAELPTFFYKITACSLLKVKVYHVFW